MAVALLLRSKHHPNLQSSEVLSLAVDPREGAGSETLAAAAAAAEEESPKP
jgi:hypothetical protein